MRIEKPLLVRVYDPGASCFIAVYDLANGQNWTQLIERVKLLTAEWKWHVSMDREDPNITFVEHTFEDDAFLGVDEDGWKLVDEPLEIDDRYVMKTVYSHLVVVSEGVYWVAFELHAYGKLSTYQLSAREIREVIMPRLRERKKVQEMKV
jgi:hypothetical protein